MGTPSVTFQHNVEVPEQHCLGQSVDVLNVYFSRSHETLVSISIRQQAELCLRQRSMCAT